MSDISTKYGDIITKNIISSLTKETEVVFDPMTALAIASLVVNILRLLQPIIQKKCAKNKEKIGEYAHNPKPFHRILVKWQVRRAMRILKRESPELYNSLKEREQLVDKMVSSIFETAKFVPIAEINNGFI